MERRKFLASTGLAVGAMMISQFEGLASQKNPDEVTGTKRKFALVGTGIRGVNMFGRDLIRDYGQYINMVALVDINPGRLQFADEFIGAGCPTFTNLEEMITKQRPDVLIVASCDSSHHDIIIKGMEMGCDIICEKPLTIDDHKSQAIIDVQERTGRNIIVTFNYRYPPYRAKLKELIMGGLVGDINTVDFHWNINHSHLMRYMQRWHGYSARGGTLWVHKSTHHFDMVNWILNSEPEEVFAFSSLDRFGKHGPFRGRKCRDCSYTQRCVYYWDITKDPLLTGLYVNNEHYDGYIRDNCVFRREIDIFERHAAVVKYANGTMLNYSLTGDTDFDGYWIAFNGTKGRIEARIEGYPSRGFAELVFTPIDRFTDQSPRIFRIDHAPGGHWGGDPLMMDKLFKDPDKPDPLHQQATLRDGVMSVLTGVAARRSSITGLPIKLKGLTSYEPRAVRL